MENAKFFRNKIASNKTALGTCITFIDPTITEALTNALDFVWIDMEHNAMSLERVQGHIMATKGSETTPLVRIPVNDPSLVKPVLDIGAAGVIVPLVKTAADIRLAVSACRYPPEGIRGIGPRRPSSYGLQGGLDYFHQANQSIITIVQIEQIEALNNLSDILAVPGLTSVVVGPNDLAASLGYLGQTSHPEVLRAIDTVIAKSKAAKIPMGIAVGDDPDLLVHWADKGVNWLSIGADFVILMRAALQLTSRVRDHQRDKG